MNAPISEAPPGRESRDSERDNRTGAQWLQSALAYCKWRAGDSWRKTWRAGERWNPNRLEYLDAARCLSDLLHYDADAGRILPVLAPLHPAPLADPREPVLRRESRAALAAALMELNPYSDYKLLTRLPRPKLVRLLCRALDDVAAARPERRRA